MKRTTFLLLAALFLGSHSMAQETHRVNVSVDQSNCITSTVENQSLDLDVFPNPSTGIFTVQNMNSIISGEVNVTVYDLLGKKMYSKRMDNPGQNLEIDLIGASKGYYLLKISAQNKTYTNHLIIK